MNKNHIQSSPSNSQYNVVELHMMNKTVFIPLTCISTLSVSTLVYPVQVVRTRMQLQDLSSKSGTHYRGITHALLTIAKREGLPGLYSGYFVRLFQNTTGLSYLMAYEGIRGFITSLPTHLRPSNEAKSFISGFGASALTQTVLVPFDIIIQHLMVLNTADMKKSDRRALTPLQLTNEQMSSAAKRTRAIVSTIYSKYGFRAGFYKGFLISVATFGPSHGFWWLFYHRYCETLNRAWMLWTQKEEEMPRLLCQQIAAPLSGFTNSILMNPLDVIRVRMQVHNTSLSSTVNSLWREDGLRMFTKGLSARILQSCIYSFCVIFFYERVKMFSLKDEYKSLFEKTLPMEAVDGI